MNWFLVTEIKSCGVNEVKLAIYGLGLIGAFCIVEHFYLVSVIIALISCTGLLVSAKGDKVNYE